MPTDIRIQDKLADSMNEVYLAQAFTKLNIDFIYKYDIFGASMGLRGGIEVDFVLLPFKEPVELFGEYWHSGQLGADDKMKLAREFQYFKRETIIFWGDETDTPEKALNAARMKVNA
jgi:hypothetical protein